MRNWTHRSGVYNNMLRVPLYLVCSLAALAQPMPQQDPLDASLQAIWQAQGNGRFAEAAAGRERARALLQLLPWIRRDSQAGCSSWRSSIRIRG